MFHKFYTHVNVAILSEAQHAFREQTYRALHCGGLIARAAPFQAHLDAAASARPASVESRPAQGEKSPRTRRWKPSCKPSRIRRLGDEFRPARPPTTMLMVFSSAGASPRMIAVAPASCRWCRWPKSSSCSHLLHAAAERRRRHGHQESMLSGRNEGTSGRVEGCCGTYLDWLPARGCSRRSTR